jgi:hypothetical protein
VKQQLPPDAEHLKGLLEEYLALRVDFNKMTHELNIKILFDNDVVHESYDYIDPQD